MAEPELHPDYYWRNLRTVVETVLDAHPGLFTPEQHALFEAWRALPREAQLLHSRLLLRKGPDFRRSSLAYSEVGDLDRALAALAEARLVTLDPALPLTERVELFTVPELRAVASEMGIQLRGRRGAIVEGLLQLPADTVENRLRRLDPLVRRHGCTAFSRAQVVFFGNRQQDMSTFVRVALDQLRYPDYAVDRSHPLFADRAALDEYLAAGARWDAAFAARMAGDDATLAFLGAEAAQDLVRRADVAPFRARVDPARADSRVVYRAARAHERRGEVQTADDLYRLLLSTRRHLPTAARAADRLGLMRQRLGRTTDLLDLVTPLLGEPGLDDASSSLVDRRLRLARVLNGPSEAEPLVPERELSLRSAQAAPADPGDPADEDPPTPAYAGSKALYVGVTGEARTVEEAVLERLGGDGVWCEGSLYTTLFGLLCWDIIFAAVPGAFQHAFQDAPVDFDTALFYLRREPRFRARFATLADADLAAEVATACQRHGGRSCRGVAWDRYPPGLLARAATALGPRLIPILQRLARHPGRHAAGLPDLFLWTAEGPLLVEVKGPGDQPSVEQRLWHGWLLQHEVPFLLMRVRRTT